MYLNWKAAKFHLAGNAVLSVADLLPKTPLRGCVVRVAYVVCGRDIQQQPWTTAETPPDGESCRLGRGGKGTCTLARFGGRDGVGWLGLTSGLTRMPPVRQNA
uniref:Uncharacterized protein n=1 Tax=Oryza punctata TaxID=4537 RepID=A0A0E0K2N2_ORYPU